MMGKLNPSFINENINELDTKSYAGLMNKTYNYPWEKFFSKNPDKDINPKELGSQQGRINTLARDRFLNAFNREYPENSVSINTNNGVYYFDSIKFKTNYTYYDLIFKKQDDHSGDYLWIMPDNNSYYIDKKDLKITDDNSDKVIRELLKYNLNYS